MLKGIMEEKKSLVRDLSDGPVLSTMLSFAFPIMLANALQAVYNMVDMIVVGRFVGPTGLSGVGIGGNLQTLFLTFGMGFANGAQIVISQQVGMKSSRISKSIGTLLTLEFIMAVIIGAIGIIFHAPLLNMLNTPEASYDQAMAYMVICSAGMIFIFEYNALCAVLRGMGESKLPMVFVGIASIINVVLDIIFVGPCGWGAGGAAAATVIAQAVACICAAVYLYRHKEAAQFDFKLKSFGIDKEQLKALCRLGVPSIVQMLMITVSLAFVNSRINLYDVTASAVDTVGNKLATIVNILTGAISVASGSMVAQSFAAGKMDRIKKIVHVAVAVGLIWFVVMAACYLLLPRQIFGIFTTDQAVLDMAPAYCRIMVLWLLAACTMFAPYAVVKGIGFASYDMFVGIMDGVVARIGLAMLFGNIAGLYGYWTGNAIAGFVTTILMGGYYLTGKWKTRKVITR